MSRVTGGHLKPARDRDRWRSMVTEVQVDVARR